MFLLSCLGDFKFTGRDSLVFLVDASKEMFIKGEDGEPSNFDMTMQVNHTRWKWPMNIYIYITYGGLGVVSITFVYKRRILFLFPSQSSQILLLSSVWFIDNVAP